MSDSGQERLFDLLAEDASQGLSVEQSEELDILLLENQEIETDELLQAAALAQLSFLKQDDGAQDSMPESLKQRVLSNAQIGVIPTPVDRDKPVAEPEKGSSWFGLPAFGWYAAAALSAVLLFSRPAAVPPVPTLEQQVQQLMQSCSGVTTHSWQAPDAPGFESVTGDVVWCQDGQQGFMRLANMPVNSPTEAQYQLWIVDPERDKNPVDGGVFDIASNGSVIVPIDAKLEITSPAAFAITKEIPGGVVVSAGPLLVVAPVET